MTKNDNIQNNNNKKKILLISYHFPPSTAVGGFRIANFAKYLPSCGWTPHVLTVEDHMVEAIDWERVKDVEAIKIIKALQLPTLIDAYLFIKKRSHRILKKDFAVQAKQGISDYSSNGDPSDSERLFQRLKRYLISMISQPDAERGWILPATLQAVREIKREKIDCILTSCPPYSVHIIGLLVKMITGVKWVVDFRDPWMTTGIKIVPPTCALTNAIESRLEKKVIQKADLVIFNADRLKEAYREKYTTEPVSKFVWIPNGFDRSIFSMMGPPKKYEKFTLSYTGTLYMDRTPDPIFQALYQLLSEGKVGMDAINVKLVGNCKHVGGYPITRIIQKYGLEGVVEVLDPVTYMKALEIIRQSHVALLFAPNQPYQIPAKVYDYLGAGIKILAIAEPGATSDLINSTKCGKAFLPSDTAGIKEFILQAMNNEKTTGENYSAVLHQFDAKRLSESLSDNLNKIVDQELA
jgi:glycosyltransferase involved in cell wall biosynthesis